MGHECKYSRSASPEEHEDDLLELLIECSRILCIVLAVLTWLASGAVTAAAHQTQRLLQQSLLGTSLGNYMGAKL